MAKFRKKPVVIDAYRFDGTWQSVRSLNPGPNQILFVDRVRHGGYTTNQLDVRTLEGTMTANEGDWIIRGVKGEFYPCRPDIFAATYEAVAEDDTEEQVRGIKRATS
jgi:hypothetical protein